MQALISDCRCLDVGRCHPKLSWPSWPRQPWQYVSGKGNSEHWGLGCLGCLEGQRVLIIKLFFRWGQCSNKNIKIWAYLCLLVFRLDLVDWVGRRVLVDQLCLGRLCLRWVLEVWVVPCLLVYLGDPFSFFGITTWWAFLSRLATLKLFQKVLA